MTRFSTLLASLSVLMALAGLFAGSPDLPLAYAQAAPSSPIASVKAQTGNKLESPAPSYWFEVAFDDRYQSGGVFFEEILNSNISDKWDCRDPRNYKVLFHSNGNSAKQPTEVRIRRVTFETGDQKGAVNACKDALVLPKFKKDTGDVRPLLLFVDENQPMWHSLNDGYVTVEILKLKDKGGNVLDIKSKDKDPGAAVKWKLNIFTVSAQTVNNEKLTDKTIFKKTVYQFPISSMLPFAGTARGGAFVETKDLFSTNERDSKSAFMAGAGYQVGLRSGWTVPLKLEQQVTGNQVATNLSAVSSVLVSTTAPWTDRLTPGPREPVPSSTAPPATGAASQPKAPTRVFWPAWDMAPMFSVAFPYTHRINQVVAPGSKPLQVNDFALNPAVALTNERLLEIWGKKGKDLTKVAPFATAWEANWGLWYLPLETTTKGSQRAEGSGDVSILIPISNFGVFPGLTIDQKTQNNQMQFRIKWSDTVDPTNNYVRSRNWTFGLELIGKK
jgi:hypothetical protein